MFALKAVLIFLAILALTFPRLRPGTSDSWMSHGADASVRRAHRAPAVRRARYSTDSPLLPPRWRSYGLVSGARGLLRSPAV